MSTLYIEALLRREGSSLWYFFSKDNLSFMSFRRVYCLSYVKGYRIAFYNFEGNYNNAKIFPSIYEINRSCPDYFLRIQEFFWVSLLLCS